MDIRNDVIKKLITNTKFDYIHPAAKILCFFFFIAIVFVAENLLQLAILFLMIALFLKIIKINNWYFIRPIFILLLFFPITLIFNMIVIETGEPLFDIGNQTIYLGSIRISIEIFFRIYLLILVSSVLILSLTETELTNGIETTIYPLKYLKIPIQEIALIISISLRYIPAFIYETKLILKSEASRGIDFYSGTTKNKVVALKNSLTPLIFNSFSKAKELSIAMSVRGYEIGKKRTKFETYKFDKDEIFLVTYFAFLFIIILLLNIFNVHINF